MTRRINKAPNFIKRHMVPTAKTWVRITRSWRLNHPVHIIITVPNGGGVATTITSTNPAVIGVAALSATKFLISALTTGVSIITIDVQSLALGYTQTVGISVIP